MWLLGQQRPQGLLLRPEEAAPRQPLVRERARGERERVAEIVLAERVDVLVLVAAEVEILGLERPERARVDPHVHHARRAVRAGRRVHAEELAEVVVVAVVVRLAEVRHFARRARLHRPRLYVEDADVAPHRLVADRQLRIPYEDGDRGLVRLGVVGAAEAEAVAVLVADADCAELAARDVAARVRLTAAHVRKVFVEQPDRHADLVRRVLPARPFGLPVHVEQRRLRGLRHLDLARRVAVAHPEVLHLVVLGGLLVREARHGAGVLARRGVPVAVGDLGPGQAPELHAAKPVADGQHGDFGDKVQGRDAVLALLDALLPARVQGRRKRQAVPPVLLGADLDVEVHAAVLGAHLGKAGAELLRPQQPAVPAVHLRGRAAPAVLGVVQVPEHQVDNQDL